MLLNNFIAFSDGGNCVKYKVIIKFFDETELKGYVFSHGYDYKIEFDDITFLDYLKNKKHTYRDSIYFYPKIVELKYPDTKDYNLNTNCKSHFDATPQGERQRYALKDISNIIVEDIYKCNKCSDGYWASAYDIILELNREEIDLLQTKPILSKSYYMSGDVAGTTYFFISYNENLNETQIDSTWNEYILIVKKLRKEHKYKESRKKYLEMKNQCRNRKLIVFLMHDKI